MKINLITHNNSKEMIKNIINAYRKSINLLLIDGLSIDSSTICHIKGVAYIFASLFYHVFRIYLKFYLRIYLG